jgi:hypothetical protein
MNSEELKSDVEKLSDNLNGHSGSGQNKNAVEIEDATFQWESNQVGMYGTGLVWLPSLRMKSLPDDWNDHQATVA